MNFQVSFGNMVLLHLMFIVQSLSRFGWQIPTLFANVINWMMNEFVNLTFYINQSPEVSYLMKNGVCLTWQFETFQTTWFMNESNRNKWNWQQKKYIRQLHNQNRKQSTIDILKFMHLNAERWTCRNLQCATISARTHLFCSQQMSTAATVGFNYLIENQNEKPASNSADWYYYLLLVLATMAK